MKYAQKGDIMYVIKLKTIIIYLLVISVCISLAWVANTHALPTAAKEDETDGRVPMPILMYHSVCDSGGKQSKFVVSSDAVEEDLKYISENGYTPISSADLIAYVNGDAELPQKPVMLTFDDGYYNNYCYVYPLLKKYNAKAVISIIGKYTDLYSEGEKENPLYSHITWNEAREMIESGLVEIENHSYNSHTTDKGRNGTKKKSGESAEAYSNYFHNDIGRLQEEINQNLGYYPQLFAYPFGSISNASYDILKEMGFKVTLSCEEKVNYPEPNNPDSLYMLGRYLRTDKRSAAKILSKMK